MKSSNGKRRRRSRWRKCDDQGGRPVRRLGSQWSATPGIGDSQLAAAEITTVENGIDRFVNLRVIRRGKSQSGRRATHAIQVPAYREGTVLGDFQRLENAVSDQQPVISAANERLPGIVVNAAVQPDPELTDQAFWGGCGELHHVRLPAHS